MEQAHCIDTKQTPAVGIRGLARKAARLTVRMVVGWIDAVAEAMERSRQREQLAHMNEHMLSDLGLSHADVARECAKRPWQP
ncbi:MAG: DUF1127 domain-containing protein [Rhodobacterales bacterium]|nr:DUF1127 domain-containing protein [Rhodobacterales bacterium]